MHIKSNLFCFRARLQPVTPFAKKCTNTAHVFTDGTDAVKSSRKVSFLFHAILYILLFASAPAALSQTYVTTAGTSNNIFPFGSSTTNNKVQWLYIPADFTSTLPTGSITKLYFRTFSSTYAATYSNFSIKMGTTSATAFSSGTFITGLTPVFSAASFAVPSTGPYSWFSVTLSSPFFYNIGDNFIVEIEHTGITSGSITASHIAATNRRIYGNAGSTSGTFGANMGDLGLDILTGPPCPAPGAPSATNITSTSAQLNWVAPPTSVGYSYTVTTNALPPSSGFSSTTATTYQATSLTPATTYYLHIRNNCSPTNWSPWVTYQFKTNPPCDKRSVRMQDVTTNSATISWNKEAHGTQYEYVMKLDTPMPTSATATSSTVDSFYKPTGLAEGTTYYFFVRMYCPGNEKSPWAMDSFTTRTICRPPMLNINYVEANRAVVYWKPMPTAIAYEYEVSQSPTPLGKGTKIKNTDFYAFPLRDGQTYYFHVRSQCDDQGFESVSDWTTSSFRTFPTSVSNTAADNFTISVHPNPVQDVFYVDIMGIPAVDATITLMDISGKAVRMQKLKGNRAMVDMSGLSSGLYLMKYADKTYSEVIKLTKQ